jgi:hypothetical protein
VGLLIVVGGVAHSKGHDNHSPSHCAFTQGVISFLVTSLDHVTCVFVADDIPQVLFFLTLATLTQRLYAAGRVPTQVLALVRVLTLPPVSSVKGRVHHCGSIKHCVEALDLRVYFLAVLRHQGHELIDDDPRGQIVVCRHVVNLLALPLNLTDFFMECSRSIPESFSASRSLPVELSIIVNNVAASIFGS